MEEGTVTVTPESTEYSASDPDYTEQLDSLMTDVEGIGRQVKLLEDDVQELLENSAALTGYAESVTVYMEYVAGFGLFAVVVTLCYFSYKFFKMFF